MAILIGLWAIKNFGVGEAVAVCKIVSLGGLIVVSEGISREITGNDVDIRRLNRAIVLVSVAILVFLTIELMFVNIDTASRLNEPIQIAARYIFSNIYWASALPIFSYAVLNFWVGFVRDKKGEY